MIHHKYGVGNVHIKNDFYGKYPVACFIISGNTIAWLASPKGRRRSRRFITVESCIAAIDRSVKSDYVRMRTPGEPTR